MEISKAQSLSRLENQASNREVRNGLSRRMIVGDVMNGDWRCERSENGWRGWNGTKEVGRAPGWSEA